MRLDGEENARTKRRNIYTETKRPFAAFLRATATPCRHASNIKADKRSEWKYPEQNVWIPNHG